MAKSHGIAQMLSALVFCGLLVLAGRHFVSMTLQDNFAQPAEPQPAAQRFGNASLATAKTTPSHIGRSPSGSPLPAASLPPAKSPRAQQLWIMTLPELLNFGRDLALAGDQHSLQQLVGRALIRHITRNPPRTVDNVMALLANVDEPAALRQTILEALVHTISALPNNAKADLFYQSLHILQYDNDPALRSAALRAASAFAIALKNSDQPLPAAATADLHRLALGYVDAQHEPPELRQTAICELVTTYPSSDFPPKLLAILGSPSQYPTAVVRCATVALTDLQQASALPVMSHLLNQGTLMNIFSKTICCQSISWITAIYTGSPMRLSPERHTGFSAKMIPNFQSMEQPSEITDSHFYQVGISMDRKRNNYLVFRYSRLGMD